METSSPKHMYFNKHNSQMFPLYSDEVCRLKELPSPIVSCKFKWQVHAQIEMEFGSNSSVS